MTHLARLPVLFLFLLLGACGSNAQVAHLPVGDDAYAIVPPPDANAPRTSYVIVPNDVLNLQVFQEPDLSNEELQVDNLGNIQIPLIGEIQAAGRTATEIADDIEKRLGARYIVNPQVVVSIAKQAERFVTVEGQVEKPGVYEVAREDTLLSAIARAESTTREAALDEVVVFRTIDGRRMAARFNLSDVRSGRAPDPQIQGGDAVVVGFSALKGAWQDILKAAPLFNSFAFLLTRN
ncbi:MAG: polysaccharide export protein [Novosphingobium sp.]|nr:polysaccharide export protein [Novosphingobium sp.]